MPLNTNLDRRLNVRRAGAATDVCADAALRRPQRQPAPGSDDEPDPTVIVEADVLDGLHATRRTFANMSIAETVVLDGYGVTVRVSRGALECCDGLGETRRARRITRAAAAAGQVRRVLVLGDGIVTTEAMAWCAALGVALVVADQSGEPLAAGTRALFDHGGLRRAQALAAFTSTGMTVVRWLLDRRLADQVRIARDLLCRDDRAFVIEELRRALAEVNAAPDAMVVEMRAAEHYWAAWGDECRLAFAAKDRRRVPAHWQRFGGRGSPLNEAASNRHAASPANALLNYGYRLAEIETTILCRAIGLDPGIGVAHARPEQPAGFRPRPDGDRAGARRGHRVAAVPRAAVSEVRLCRARLRRDTTPRAADARVGPGAPPGASTRARPGRRAGCRDARRRRCQRGPGAQCPNPLPAQDRPSRTR